MSRREKQPVRLRRVDLDALIPDARASLVQDLFQIFSSHYAAHDRGYFEAHVLAPECDRMDLVVFESREGAVVGFCNAYLCDVQLDGRPQTVMRGGVFARRGYDCARHITRIGVRLTAWHYLRRPRQPLWFFAIGANAASFRLFPRATEEVYPAPGQEQAPPTRLFAPLAARFGLDVCDDAPWICRFETGTRDPGRLKRSDRLRSCPHARYFEAQVGPRGEGHVLLILLPVTARNVGVAIARALRGALGPRAAPPRAKPLPLPSVPRA